MKVFLLVACVVMVASAQTRSGGLSRERDATPLIQALVDDLKNEILEHAGVNSVSAYTAVSFREQVVGGMNYYIKIRIGNGNYIHARLFVRSWENLKQVTAVQAGKSWEDPIEYIDMLLPMNV